jgi:hypothetical protein
MFDQNTVIAKLFSCGEKYLLWEKGEFFMFNQN